MKQNLKFDKLSFFCKVLFFVSTTIFIILILVRGANGADAKRPPNPALYTGASCKNDSDCKATEDFCNELGLCECKFSNAPKVFHNITICMGYKCTTGNECSSLYGPHTACSFNRCLCQTSFQYSPSDRECLTNAKKLGDACKSTSECGNAAICGETSTCQCQVGSAAVNEYACDLFYCKDDAQCAKVTPNSSCQKYGGQVGTCSCQGIYAPNSFNTKCVRRGKDRGASCNVMLDCGSGATCAAGVCKCSQGWIPSTKNTIDCDQIKCRSQKDCTNNDGNSYCDTVRDQCNCLSDYFVDQPTQKCQKINVIDVLPMILYIVAGSLIVSGVFIIVGRMYLQSKRAKGRTILK